jgi:hypothetical protein
MCKIENTSRFNFLPLTCLFCFIRQPLLNSFMHSIGIVTPTHPTHPRPPVYMVSPHTCFMYILSPMNRNRIGEAVPCQQTGATFITLSLALWTSNVITVHGRTYIYMTCGGSLCRGFNWGRPRLQGAPIYLEFGTISRHPTPTLLKTSNLDLI